MHDHLIHQTQTKMDASVFAASWTSTLAKDLERQAQKVGFHGRLSQECLDELQGFFAGLLEAQHRVLRQRVTQRKSCHDWAKVLRRERDEAAREVYGQLVEVRGLVRNLLGKKAEAQLFGSGCKTPREPWELVRVAENVAMCLGHPGAEEERCRGLANEELWSAVVARMAEPMGRLREVLHEIDRLGNEERVAVNRLHESKDRLHQDQLRIFRVQEALFEMAGCEDLAEELRSAKRSRRRSQRAAPEPKNVAPNVSGTARETIPTPSDASGAVPDTAESVETPTHSEPRIAAAAETDVHPVRKVLQWLQTAPHRVRNVPETPETASPEVEAA